MSESPLTPMPSHAVGPVTCAVCGCRLTPSSGIEDGAWRHFPSLLDGSDARGDRPFCVDMLHGRDGRPLAADTAAA